MNLSDEIIKIVRMERPEAQIDGYLAERPQLMSHCIRVWAPCGCCWTYAGAEASVLTACVSESCNFSWTEASAALARLQELEKQNEHRNAEAERPQLQTGEEPGPMA
jgi:hypothetical protein